MRLDHGRPKDDATVVAVKVTAAGENDEVRRMSIRLPI